MVFVTVTVFTTDVPVERVGPVDDVSQNFYVLSVTRHTPVMPPDLPWSGLDCGTNPRAQDLSWFRP